jgi:hypothetical protein
MFTQSESTSDQPVLILLYMVEGRCVSLKTKLEAEPGKIREYENPEKIMHHTAYHFRL